MYDKSRPSWNKKTCLMKRTPSTQSVSLVISHLPFPLEDHRQANSAFVRWRENRTEAAKEAVDLWTYCFVYRYFSQCLVRYGLQQGIAFDVLVERAFRRISENLGQLRDPNRYTAWVGIICRRTFFNLRRGPVKASLEEVELVVYEPTMTYGPADGQRVRRAVQGAINRLPPFLQETAQYYLQAGYSYHQISYITHKSVPTIRTYVSRIMVYFRTDPLLVALYQELSA